MVFVKLIRMNLRKVCQIGTKWKIVHTKQHRKGLRIYNQSVRLSRPKTLFLLEKKTKKLRAKASDQKFHTHLTFQIGVHWLVEEKQQPCSAN